MSNTASFFSKKRSVDQTRGSNARVRLRTPSCSARMVDQRRNPNAAAKSGTPTVMFYHNGRSGKRPKCSC